LRYLRGGDAGPAQGAARLARLAVTGEAPEAVCKVPPVEHIVEPDPELAEIYASRRRQFQSLYQKLKTEFAGVSQ
jgi:xylulokinase